MQTWLAPTVQIMTALAATAVAAFVAQISFRQWQISRDKLRLDLFNRRFDVYLRVLDYYQELLKWQGREEQKSSILPFVKAVRESRFIFPEKSGVFAFLEEFQRHADRVYAFENMKDAMKMLPAQDCVNLTQERLQHVNWILDAMSRLEDKMAPYIRFDNM